MQSLIINLKGTEMVNNSGFVNFVSPTMQIITDEMIR
jgi:hypothetical protein